MLLITVRWFRLVSGPTTAHDRVIPRPFVNTVNTGCGPHALSLNFERGQSFSPSGSQSSDCYVVSASERNPRLSLMVDNIVGHEDDDR